MNNENDSLHQRGRAMEEAFFRNVDAQLLARLKSESESTLGHSELVRQTGITDDALVDALVAHGVTSEGLVALRFIPLVMVAWADREVTEEERKTVLGEAKSLGVRADTTAYLLLEQWLHQCPTDDLADAWKRYTTDLLGRFEAGERQSFVRELKREMLAVAKASGGAFGFGKVSKSESETMDKMLEALE
jgi:hypothetical protein